MVNSKVIRVSSNGARLLSLRPSSTVPKSHLVILSPQGGGLVILAGCYVAVDRSFNNNVLDDATNMFGGLIGAGLGSMYNVRLTCSASLVVVFSFFSQPSQTSSSLLDMFR